jgi:hypothetical protein
MARRMGLRRGHPPDPRGRRRTVWMNTNRGIFWVARAAERARGGRAPRIHSTAYTERDGMRNREGNGGVQPAGARARRTALVPDPGWRRGRRPGAGPSRSGVPAAGGGADRGGSAPPGARLDRARPRPADQIEYTALTFLELNNVRHRLDPYDAGWGRGESTRGLLYESPSGPLPFLVEASMRPAGYEPDAARRAVLPAAWRLSSAGQPWRPGLLLLSRSDCARRDPLAAELETSSMNAP